MPRDAGRRVVLDVGSAELRRELGPSAWVVFEELLLASIGPADCCVASMSVRALASRLGLAKDTVARALIRLRRVGLVTAVQTRGSSGVFAAGSYALTVPDTITFAHHRATVVTNTTARSQSARRPIAQLSLALDA
jgi:DNA-binding transcriptional ArsR family regulator